VQAGVERKSEERSAEETEELEIGEQGEKSWKSAESGGEVRKANKEREQHATAVCVRVEIVETRTEQK
jgi:hypothetical protein